MAETDLKFQVYTNKMSNFFNELLEFKLTYDGELKLQDYNMINKVMVNYFNSGVFKEFIGGKYKLSKMDGQEHYALYDSSHDGPVNNLYIADDTYVAIEEKYPVMGKRYVEQLAEFIEAVENSIHDPADNFMIKRKKYLSKMKVVDFSMSDEELKFQDSFFKSEIGQHYNVNFKTQTIKTLIEDKLNMESPIQTLFCNNFAEHYSLLKQMMPYEFYPEYIGSAYAFNKQCHFMHDELDLLYMPSKTDHYEHSRNIDHQWVLLHQKNRYAGGVVISKDTVNEIRHISLKKSVENKDNYKKILNDILSHDSCSKSVFITAPEIQDYGLEDELRKEYKNRPLYFTQKEKHAYFILEAFIELNGLSSQGEKIKNDFYKNVILKNDKIINGEDLFEYSYEQQLSPVDLLMDKFKLDVLKKYQKSTNNLEVIDRESFIRRCFVSQHDESDYKYYLQNHYEGLDFAFRIPLDGNGTTDILNIVKPFLLDQDIDYNSDVHKALYTSIDQYKQIATHESTNKQFLTYSYHTLYETLSSLNVIKTKQEPSYVFRLELADGKGVYKSDDSADDFITTNNAAILEYDQRKVPQRDKGLSTLFLAYDSRYMISNNYADHYNFAFTSKEQMLSWFDKDELMTFAKLGTKLYRYEVPAVNMIASQVQVAFNRDKVISKTELNLHEFLNTEPEIKPVKTNKIKL